ncbi:hypothetical protein FO519_001012 [Halicephalobus sp. NKZ332]|nr:hypothetical protein FO519_001012 [Halicephalobus sp. NKZ332]
MIFHIANMMRLFYIAVGCFILPGLAVERVFATYYVSDYEIKPRRIISVSLVIFIDFLSLCFMITFIYDICSIIVHITVVAVINGLALGLFLYWDRKNITFYKESLKSVKAQYSLSERFQVIENIRVAKMIKKMFLCSFGFNFILIILFVVSMVCHDMLISNLVYELFDLMIAFYATVIPGITYLENKVFQKEFRRILHKWYLLCGGSRSRVESAKPHLKTVLGVKLIHDQAEGTKAYFDQLAKIWN